MLCLIPACTNNLAHKTKKNILIVAAYSGDKEEIRRTQSSNDYSFIFHQLPSYKEETLNISQIIDQLCQEVDHTNINGVLSSEDYAGCIIASVLAHKWNLPGPTPISILTCQHKYYSRIAQQESVPDATPRFALIDTQRLPTDLTFSYPIFVKPVKSYFSMYAQQINSPQELAHYAPQLMPNQQFRDPFNQCLAQLCPFTINADYLLAEELLEGQQVTLEGYIQNKQVGIIGVVDSIMHPGTISFLRFEYPSQLSAKVQDRMATIATKYVAHIGLDNTLFNMEFMYNPADDTVKIIEVNSRMALQFCDLYEKVNGINSYSIALAIATGAKPEVKKDNAPHNVAASFVMRVFNDAIVSKVPTAEEIESVKEKFPDTRIKIYVRQGRKLSNAIQDGKSFRYATINLGGSNWDDLYKKYEQCREKLTFVFTSPVNESVPGTTIEQVNQGIHR